MTHDTQIIERLARIEEKFDNFLMRAADQHDRIDDHETRLRSIEGRQSRQLGVMGTVSAIFAVAGAAAFDRLF